MPRTKEVAAVSRLAVWNNAAAIGKSTSASARDGLGAYRKFLDYQIEEKRQDTEHCRQQTARATSTYSKERWSCSLMEGETKLRDLETDINDLQQAAFWTGVDIESRLRRLRREKARWDEDWEDLQSDAPSPGDGFLAHLAFGFVKRARYSHIADGDRYDLLTDAIWELEQLQEGYSHGAEGRIRAQAASLAALRNLEEELKNEFPDLADDIEGEVDQERGRLKGGRQ